MVKKKYVKSRQVWKVTFELAPGEISEGLTAQSVHLVGDFNNWEPNRTPMKRGERGVFRTMLELEPNHQYQFRYLVNGEHWCNDWAADDYVPGGMGEDNCVIVLGSDAS